MSFLKQVQQTFQKEYRLEENGPYDYKQAFRQRMIDFRKSDKSVVRVDRPTNLARARSIGYKAKPGFVVVRSAVRKGTGQKHRPKRARKPKRMGINKLTRKVSIQTIAERRAQKRFPNCEVLNSYWVGEDGQSKYFEVVMVDVAHPAIKADKDLAWITWPEHRHRVHRGLTPSARGSRGLHKRGKGVEKVRPSLRAHKRHGN